MWVSLREGVVATADAAGDLEARSLREDGEAREAGPEQHEQRTWLGLAVGVGVRVRFRVRVRARARARARLTSTGATPCSQMQLRCPWV